MAYFNATPPVALHDDSFFVPARHSLTATSIAQMFTEDMWSSTGFPAGVYRPLVVLSIAANGALFGSDPIGYHATNIALHMMASVAVYTLLSLLLGAEAFWAALLAAAIFAVHPVHTEVVNSVYNRSEMMVSIAVAGALWAIFRWHQQRPVLAWSSATVLYFVALLCRESAASLPVLAVAMLWLLHPDDSWSARIRRVLPAAVLVFPLVEYFLLRSFALSDTIVSAAPVLGVDAGQDLFSRFMFSISALREYARMMVWPSPLRVSYENFTGGSTALTVLLHTGLIGGAVAFRRRLPLITLAIAFFYIALLPSTRIFTSSGASLEIGGFVLLKPQSGLVLVAERVAYLPSVALALAVGAVLASIRPPRARMVAFATTGVLLVVGAMLTVHRNSQWHSAPELFRSEVAAAPDNGDGWRLLVSALTAAGHRGEAERACDTQLKQSNRSAQLFNNCGALYDQLQRDDAAILSYQRAIEMGLAAVGHANLGRVYARQGRQAEAEAEFVAAIDAETNPAQRHYRTGMMLLRFHPDRTNDARSEFEDALKIRPDFVAARNALSQMPR